MDDELKKRFQIELSGAEALVLFEWLARFDESEPTFVDQAEQRALWTLEAMLEKQLVAPFKPNYDEILARARAAVRDEE